MFVLYVFQFQIGVETGGVGEDVIIHGDDELGILLVFVIHHH